MNATPKDSDYEHRVSKSFAKQSFMNYIKAELQKIEPGYCEIKLPFSENLTQQHGFFHAGIVATLADNASGYAAFSLMAASSSVLTVEYKINLMSPAKGEYLIGKSKVIKNGKTLTICQSEVFASENGEQKLCAIAQVTLMELKDTYDGIK
ncbi:MAG: PaaI family thioesterase [Gelidibacter sp.]